MIQNWRVDFQLLLTFPVFPATKLFCIFIASRTQTSCPSDTWKHELNGHCIKHQKVINDMVTHVLPFFYSNCLNHSGHRCKNHWTIVRNYFFWHVLHEIGATFLQHFQLVLESCLKPYIAQSIMQMIKALWKQNNRQNTVFIKRKVSGSYHSTTVLNLEVV